ncbi:MAG: hypothetical protein IMF06_00510 [Proteobacteria bacterium]|nr:hypothetical protein [Pseudomonadota bacterium]
MPDLLGIGMALFLAWLFAQAAIHKLRAPNVYRRLIAVYLEADTVGRPVVWLIASVELILAVLLLLPVSRHTGLAGSAFVLFAYAGLMAMQLARGRHDLQCGCAGPASTATVTPALVIRNSVCAFLALLALAPAVDVAPSAIGTGLTLFITIFSILIYLSSEQMISNAQQMTGER